MFGIGGDARRCGSPSIASLGRQAQVVSADSPRVAAEAVDAVPPEVVDALAAAGLLPAVTRLARARGLPFPAWR